ncbi:endocuticle structural glycoprotein SgAbd-2 [Drosophila subpulchrella]|uniref:endocuticle structural glycoprotein SgAbd-2 n=1 Tax=Drosophila subpulchrella TaxID=1486046 RepID=UPI0018A12E56|nr:endocuticle structural glycoprotein SgAbd-2 [Drosophila subpulchrella]
MFKIAICLLALASGALAASIGQVVSSTTEKREIIPVLKFETDKQPDGSFHFSYEGGDQSIRQEQGVIENAGTEDEALEVSGMYSYIDANGDTVEVRYTAGKNGFVPIGTIIPKEITALAKAAADLPKYSKEDELQFRRARSQELEKKAAAVEKEVAPVEKEEPVVAKESVKVEKSEPLPAASQVVPVQVVLDAAPEAEIKAAVEAAIEKKVETKTA